MDRGRGVESRVNEIARNDQTDHKDRSKMISVVNIGKLASNEPDIEDENSEIGYVLVSSVSGH